ncbi:hypothetical protein [Geothrix sp. PMB-07]|uniref:DUF922 domain-containing protein n=1 Tax=Geothrix sp. PMB-07 TaxID=3068640 RepID=UPI002741A635|nr:hypothetical protein [Geothrix sp. PMB-07]WLT32782.1 hypothetical protein Q9293_05475 [Geothrix sp. PMB-07]
MDYRFAGLVAVLIGIGPTLHAQSIENRRLVWEDFKGTPDAASPYDAYTYWSVRYTFDPPQRTATGLRIRFHVSNRLGERSWVKRGTPRESQLAELLNHEQGHYSLGVICALEFKKAAEAFSFTSNYRAEASRLFGETLDQVLKLEKAYDAETRHMYDRAQQKAWDAKLARRIEELWEYR